MKHNSWKQKQHEQMIKHQQEMLEAKKSLTSSLLNSPSGKPWITPPMWLSPPPLSSQSSVQVWTTSKETGGTKAVLPTGWVTTVHSDSSTSTLGPPGVAETEARNLLIRAIPEADQRRYGFESRWGYQAKNEEAVQGLIAWYNDKCCETREDAEAWFRRALELTL